MFQYRQVLVRLRAGDSVREIARSGLMGRDKLGELRGVAEQQGWLDASAELPGDEAIAAALGQGQRRASSTVSSVEPHREVVRHWLEAGVQGRAIHAALKREHAYSGSYSAVVRMLRQLRGDQPPEVTVRPRLCKRGVKDSMSTCTARDFESRSSGSPCNSKSTAALPGSVRTPPPGR